MVYNNQCQSFSITSRFLMSPSPHLLTTSRLHLNKTQVQTLCPLGSRKTAPVWSLHQVLYNSAWVAQSKLVVAERCGCVWGSSPSALQGCGEWGLGVGWGSWALSLLLSVLTLLCLQVAAPPVWIFAALGPL